jgi:YidC/Oxa1 family membrane protein insertase
MERRVFIAIVLSFLVLYMYQAYFAPPPPPPAKATTTNTQSAAGGASASATAASGSAPAASAPAGPPQPQALTTEPADRQITVETSTVEAVFTNRGGRLLHWRLKDYRDSAGRPVDLVPSDLPAVEQLPFSLRFDDDTLTSRLNNSLYRVIGDTAGRVDATHGNASLAFEFQDASGIHVRKTFDFDPADYIVRFSANASNGNTPITPTVVWGPALGDIQPSAAEPGFFNRSAPPPPEVILHHGGKVDRLPINKISEQRVQEDNYRFAGVDDHYFMVVVVNPGKARFEFRPLVVQGPGGAHRQLVSQAVRFPTGSTGQRFFMGPKQFDLLRSIDTELVRAVNFGFFGWLAVPLLGALKWIHGFVANWGLSIVILTILINLAMFPLRHKSVVSMRRMQEVQPQLKAIQDRYASLKVTDPARQKMNTEMMNLYREKGINPAGGCVPMLFMMPVLFAFYAVLGYAIELRGAEFGWWIKDLSQPDPFFVLPALVIISQVALQRLTPNTSMDPAQQKMMTFGMPIMFGMIFMSTAAGTVLYWLFGNLWAIGQQHFTNWMIGPPAVPTPRPAAERKIKNAGTGRTAGAEKHS